MTLVSTVTVGAGGAASIDFTSIPQTGTDLLLIFSLRSALAATLDDLRIEINGLTSGYFDRSLKGNGSAASSSSDGAGGGYWYIEEGIVGSTATSNTFSNGSLCLTNYSSSTAKSGSIDNVSENNATGSKQTIQALRNTTTNPITSIKIRSVYSSTNILQYSTASLYTITKGSGGATVS